MKEMTDKIKSFILLSNRYATHILLGLAPEALALADSLFFFTQVTSLVIKQQM